MRDDRTELPAATPDFGALVARIHQDLRKERRIRRWRAGLPDRRITAIALLLLLVSLVAGLYLSGAI